MIAADGEVKEKVIAAAHAKVYKCMYFKTHGLRKARHV
jgi:hypothetical protein